MDADSISNTTNPRIDHTLGVTPKSRVRKKKSVPLLVIQTQHTHTNRHIQTIPTTKKESIIKQTSTNDNEKKITKLPEKSIKNH